MSLQADLFESVDLLSELPKLLVKLHRELNLNDNRLEFCDASSKTQSNKYALTLTEMPYPPMANEIRKGSTTVISYIQLKKGLADLTVNTMTLPHLSIPEGVTTGAYTEPWQHLIFMPDDPTVLTFLEALIRYTVTNYEAGATFGCCSRFKDCAAAGHCLHENILYAKSCVYRNKIEKVEGPIQRQ